MDPQVQIDRLLKQDGAQLLRKKKHAVYRLSNGKNFVLPSTGSDSRGSRNALKGLENLLGLRSAEPKPVEDSTHYKLPAKKKNAPPSTYTVRIRTTNTEACRNMQTELAKLGSLGIMLRPGVGLEIG